MTDEPAPELATPWQVRRRLIANEAERKAQADSIKELTQECRQNRERLQAAHQRIDNLEDELAEKLKEMQLLVSENDAKYAKMKEWVLTKLKGNGNGN